MRVVKMSESKGKEREDWSLVAPVFSVLSLLCLCMLLLGIESGVTIVQEDKTANLEVAND